MAITIQIQSNYDSVKQSINETLSDLLKNQEPILLAIASSLLASVSYRIHTEGKRGDGSDLGTYSNSYLKVRERKGRTEGKKVVASFTRQMELDFNVVAERGSVGLGFNNVKNFEKAGYIENMYPGTYTLSEEEIETLEKTANAYIDDLFR